MANEVWSQRLGRAEVGSNSTQVAHNSVALVDGYDLRSRANLDGPPRDSGLMTSAQVSDLISKENKKLLWWGLAAAVIGYWLLKR